MQAAPYDPRIVCNALLSEGAARKIEISNLALQKLLYFAHGLHVVETKRPLVTGYFEAWKYGPVHPAAYKAFKEAGEHPISFRSSAICPLTGEVRPLAELQDPEVLALLLRVLSSYGRLTPGRLVDISHAKGAPWHFVVDEGRSTMALGLRITDAVILERFKFHKISITAAPSGEPGEDTPFTGTGPG